MVLKMILYQMTSHHQLKCSDGEEANADGEDADVDEPDPFSED